MKPQKPQSFVWYCKHGKKIKSSECSDCFKEFITEREIRVRADERAKTQLEDKKIFCDWLIGLRVSYYKGKRLMAKIEELKAELKKVAKKT